jgi:hypothetical protein
MTWTPEQDAKIREMHGQSLNYAKIGIHFDVPGYVIRKRMKALGLVSKIKKAWTEVDDNTICTERGLGKSFSEIAQIVGRSESGVLGRYNILMGRDAFDQHWPPRDDPWAVKVNFAEHDVKVKPMRTVFTRIDHSHVRSQVGNSSAMCAP